MMDDQLDAIDWDIAWAGILDNSWPMSWNLCLAFIPLTLSLVLFHSPRSPILRWGAWLLLLITALPNLTRLQNFTTMLVSKVGVGLWLGLLAAGLGAIGLWQWAIGRIILWWLGCLVFILFLPNAAYILTDVIHFVIDVRRGYPMGTVIGILLPQYLLFITVGFQAYVVSLLNVGYFLTQRGQKKQVKWVELSLHLLTAIGVYLGRFTRFNSWDVLTNIEGLLQALQTTFLEPHAWVVMGILFGVFSSSYWFAKRVTIGLLLQSD